MSRVVSDKTLKAWLTWGTVPAKDDILPALLHELRAEMRRPALERRPEWAELAVTILMLGGDLEWSQLVQQYEYHDYDHYLRQRDSGMSREDLGEPMSAIACDRYLRELARRFLDGLRGPRVDTLRARLGAAPQP
jgi:hypothetical protein